MDDFMALLQRLQSQGSPIDVLLPGSAAAVRVKIATIRNELVLLNGDGNDFTLHYTSVVIVT